MKLRQAFKIRRLLIQLHVENLIDGITTRKLPNGATICRAADRLKKIDPTLCWEVEGAWQKLWQAKSVPAAQLSNDSAAGEISRST